MNPDQTLAEQAVKLARMVIASGAADGRLSALAASQSINLARDIIEFDHARRQTVIQGPWGRSNTEPTGAA